MDFTLMIIDDNHVIIKISQIYNFEYKHNHASNMLATMPVVWWLYVFYCWRKISIIAVMIVFLAEIC